MNPGRIIAAAIGFALPGLLVYAGYAFTFWEPNPEYWGADDRGFVIFAALVFGIIAAAAITMQGDD